MSAEHLLQEVAGICLALLLLGPAACSSSGSSPPTEDAGSGGNNGGSTAQAGAGRNGSFPSGGSTGAAGSVASSSAAQTGDPAAGTSGSSAAGGQIETGGSTATSASAGPGAGAVAGAGAGAGSAGGVQGGGSTVNSAAGAAAGVTSAGGKGGSNGGAAAGGVVGGTATTGAGGKAGAGGSAGTTSSGGAPSPSIRQTLNFNQSWKFKLGDYNGAQANSYDDSSWSTVGLPHSFSLPYFMSSKFYVGYGWYRKHFTAPADWSSKRVFLEFEGAFQDAQVYVNGKSIGEHKGGYSGFSFDITSAVVTGDNLVAVQVNNNWNAQLAPRAGDHTFSGGLYRDVNLVVTDPLHVTWYGTFVTTPTVSATSATVDIKTEIRNDNAASASCTLKTDIVDSKGATVGTVSSTQTIPASSTVTIDQTTPAIANPSLWHPDHPTLYRAVSTVSEGTTSVDSFSTTFGFRSISWSATSGFSINGSHYYLHGVDVHQDHAGWGDGVTNAGFLRDVKMVKDAGFNFIRGSHYPKDPAFGDACDQLGVLFWSENCFWGYGGATGEGSWNTAGAYPNNAGDQAAFETSVTDSLTAMIRVHRNHPSIIAWSMSNEPFFTADATKPNMSALLTKEVTLAHQLDPTRPAGIGGAQRPEGSSRIDKLGDVAGYNGDGATLSDFQNPGIPNVVTEYGSVSATRPGVYDPGWGNLSATLTNGFPTEYAWRSGQALWCAFDHGSVGGTKLETMGIIDYFRLPKRAWYWYRNAYADVAPPTWPASGTAAALQLTADKTSLVAVDGTDDAQLTVTVLDSKGNAITNNVPVTLSVTSGPGEFPTGTSITFTPSGSTDQSDIAILDGKAAIEFRSYYSGTSIIKATSPGLTAATITITSQGSPAWVEGVTPPTAARPYTRYTGGGTSGTSQTLALNRPTSASSNAGTAGYGNDGDTTTSWQAATTDTAPWWYVSLESTYTVSSVQLTFPTAANYRYTIDVSPDGTQWTTKVDQSQNTSTAQTRTATATFGTGIGFVRVSFTGQPAGLAEIAVSGSP
ncbi:MAG: glycoside hydrolase family 2 TIM barrel-domain containing protein [Polyangia bacterium]